MNIYAINGLNDILVTNSKTIEYDITIHCGSSLNWPYQCILQHTSPFNTCFSGDIQCDYHIETNSPSNVTTTGL